MTGLQRHAPSARKFLVIAAILAGEPARSSDRADVTVQGLPSLAGVHDQAVFIEVGLDSGGSRIIASRITGEVGIWDAKTGRKLRDLSLGRGNLARAVTLSPDGKFAAVGGIRNLLGQRGSNDPSLLCEGGLVMVWDLDRDRPPLVISGPKSPVMSVWFTSGESRVVSLGWDNNASEWDVKDGLQIGPTIGRGPNAAREHGVSERAFYRPEIVTCFSSGSKRIVAVANEGEERGVNLNTWDLRSRLVHPLAVPLGRLEERQGLLDPQRLRVVGDISAVAISRDGNRIVAGYSNPEADGARLLTMWEFSTGRVVREFESRFEAGPTLIALSSDGMQLIATGDLGHRGGATVEVWDIAQSKRRPTMPAPAGRPRAVAFRPGGTLRIVTGGYGSQGLLGDQRIVTPRTAGHAVVKDSGLAPAREVEPLKIWDVVWDRAPTNR